MAKNQNSFEKRRREQEKKFRADQKRKEREKKKSDGLPEPQTDARIALVEDKPPDSP